MEEYWKNRALIAEGAADKLGHCLENMLPYVDHKGSLAYETWKRWRTWYDARQCATVPESHNEQP